MLLMLCTIFLLQIQSMSCSGIDVPFPFVIMFILGVITYTVNELLE